ncbi:MAG: diguanylate cyclase [Paracoccus sp. (in: a-proteobacteria)]
MTSRFTMKARLGATNHRVVTAHDVDEALRQSAGAGAVLLRNRDLAALTRDIEVLKRKLVIPVIVVCDTDQRQAAFRAGAEHVLDSSCHDAIMRARLRRWMTRPTEVEPGLAEAVGEFDPPDQIALMTDDAPLSSDWCHAVKGATGLQLHVISPRSALSGLPPRLAAILVDGGTCAAGIQHLADLRARLINERRGTALAFIQRRAQIEEETRALDIGAIEVLPALLSAPAHQAELAARLRVLLRNGLEGERRHCDARLALRLVQIDLLTGLANRRRISADIVAVMDEEQGFSLLMIDIDRFKLINDKHGHPAGDRVLIEVARALSASVGDLGQVGRYGGEEFLVVLSGIDETVAVSLAERIRREISIMEIEAMGLEGMVRLQVSVSVGVAACGGRDGGAEFLQVLRQADTALLAAKGAGRNLVMLARPPFAVA